MRIITRLGAALLLSAALLPAFTQTAGADAKEDSPRIRVIKEAEPDAKMEAKHGKKRAERMARRAAKAVEFLGPDGKVRKRVGLGPKERKLPEGVSEIVEAKVAKSGRRVVVERKRHDSKERNPYKLRQGENVEVEWYDEDGKKLGTRIFKGGAAVRALADDGSLTVLVDEGFDPEAFEGYHDVPGLKTTETLKQDPELLDHRLYVVRPSGDVVLTRRIPGPSAPPDHIAISPSGQWLVYAVGSRRSYINNIETEAEEVFEGDTVGWSISDKGELFGWKPEGDKGRYEKVNGELIWKPGKQVFRKHIRRPGEPSMTPTDEVKDK